MSFFSEAGGEIKKIPWWAWLGGAAALLLVGSHLLSQNSTSGTASADAAGVTGVTDTSGGDVGDIGSPGPSPITAPGPSGGVNPPTGTTTSPTGTTGTTSTTTTGGTTTQSSKTYTVRSGDTLNAIASRYHVDEPALYKLNQGTIEATAKSHGFHSSDTGHWIFPGEVLKIPA